MSASKKIGIAVSDHSTRIYLSAQTVQHLGGPGTKVRFLAKKIEEGHWEMSIREDKQASFKINPHGSSGHPFKIEMAAPPYPLDRWPKTPPIKPIYIPVTYDVHQKRQISFIVRSDELAGKPDPKNPASALKPLANIIHEKYAREGETSTETIKRMEKAVLAASPIISTQPQPQASPLPPQAGMSAPVIKPVAIAKLTPVEKDIAERYAAADEAPKETIERLKKTIVLRPKTAEDVPAEQRTEREVHSPPHERLQMLLQALNSILTVDLNDIELFVEQIDETGGVVKTISLPVPSQMRIKGRRIREETFG